MSYLVLARKYRPRTFSEVVGQEGVKRTLAGAIEGDRVGHAYLFAGPRGTGKTTTARIFAKGLNCEAGPVADPCGTCERCLAVDRGAEVDLVEIDGASNNGVDQVRTLRDQAAYQPLRARYKIYLIDEVHMLSKQAFNALLKTLEEPPPHVKFLFATTEPHKVLDTILSRCQVLKLTTLGEDLIAARLDEVLAAEDITCEAGVSREVARRARGGMRDALSLTDQLLAQVGPGRAPTVADCAGLDKAGTELMDVLEAACVEDRAAVLAALPAGEGAEAELLGGLLDRVRASLLAHLCGADAPMLNGIVHSDEERQALASFGERLGARRGEAWLQELLHARERMRLLPMHARVILETCLLDMCRVEGAWDLADLAERLAALESRSGSGASASGAPATGAPGASTGATPAAAAPAFTPPPRTNGPGAAPAAAPAARPPAPRAEQAPAADPADDPANDPDPAIAAAAAAAAAFASAPPAPAPQAAAAPRPAQARPAPATPQQVAQAPATQIPAAQAPATQAPAAQAPAAQAPAAGARTAPPPPAAAPAGQPSPVAETPDRMAPAAPTAQASAAPSGPARVRTSSASDAWKGFLEELEEASPSLAQILARRGRLMRYEQDLAVVQLRGLNPMERPQVEDARNRRTCQRALAVALGREIELELQDADHAAPGREDPFTQQVAEMFKGRIEDGR